jgi:Leucine-rich repeat (LRR) protein
VSPVPELLSFADADTRLDHILSDTFCGDYDTVLLFDGDVVLDGDFLTAVGELGIDPEDYELVAVSGDLTVTGAIEMWESYPGLYVGGYTRADTLIGADAEVYLHDGTVTHLVYGEYNDGILEAGTVHTPWVINSNHSMMVTTPGAIVVDNYGENIDADFTKSNIMESFVPEIVLPEYRHLDVPAFRQRLHAGLPVLLPGARTHIQQALTDLARAKAQRATAVDLTGRRLKEFPADILEMPWLRRLVLDENQIQRLPDDIGTLVEMEYLSVHGNRLTTLPDSIGDLATLRVLRVGGNASTFELPDAVGRLINLEELDVSELSGRSYGDTLPELAPFALPDSVGELSRLRRLIANRTNLVIPPSIHGLPSLEEISMTGDSHSYLRRFPDAVTTFPHLRTLDLNGNFFDTIPETLTLLENLEELHLGEALGLVTTPLPDLSALPQLRVLDLGGHTSHSAVPLPPHSFLRQLFGMRLPTLQELILDRWGLQDTGPRGPMTADVLTGIGGFRALKRLDLSFNSLTGLPKDGYRLPTLEWLDLRCNKLDQEARRRIAAAYPNVRVDVRDQRAAASDIEREQLRATDAVLKQANAARDRREWATALAAYDRAITTFTDGSAESSYALLYAHYSKMWIHGEVGYGREGTVADRAGHRRLGVALAERCLELVPPVWSLLHFTDEAEFHREVVRYATNFIAWETSQADPVPARAALERALELIEQGVTCGGESRYIYLRDTHARVLLALGEEPDAWRVVHQADALDTTFKPMVDLKRDPRYQAWLLDLHGGPE